MNKTISINIAGIIFYVNEDAFEKLKNYLDELNEYFSKTNEGKEIYADIEGRIAEIFSEKISSTNQVITAEDVEDLIKTLGRVEDLIDEPETEKDETENKNENSFKTKKRLYRDPDDKAIGGVAKGLSYYFGIEVVLIRIIFILLFIFGGSGIWIYIVLWIAMPEAKTTIQKLEMKGDPINLSNLEKNIKDEFENVKNNIKNKKYHNDINSFFDKIVIFFGTIFKGLLKALSGVFGVIFVFIGAVFLSIIVGSVLFDTTLIQINNMGIETFSLKNFLYLVTDETNINFIFISLFFVVGIPILSLLYLGIKLVFGIKHNSKIVAVVFAMLWIFGIIILAASTIDIAKDYNYKTSVEKNSELILTSDTLYLKNIYTLDSINSNENIFSADTDDEFVLTESNIYLKPRIKIIDSENDSLIKLKIKFTSKGRNKKDALNNVENINYTWTKTNDTLLLGTHYKIYNKFRNQRVYIKIYKPSNVIIKQPEDFFD